LSDAEKKIGEISGKWPGKRNGGKWDEGKFILPMKISK